MQANIRRDFLVAEVPKTLLVVNAALALAYFIVLAFFFPPSNYILFALLIAGEVFHMWQVLTFLYTIWDMRDPPPKILSARPLGVDVFITVAGEPIDLVEKTVRAALLMHYPDFKVHILNDGLVAGKEHWREVRELAKRLGVRSITRVASGGAKAGNINNALRLSVKPLIAIFDADHVPHSSFLAKTAPHFDDPRMGFVQTPQFYKNYADTRVSNSSWEQQEIFFGPICRGKNRLNSVTMCGTNMLIRRSALRSVRGMYKDSIAEDFVTGLLLHARGYKSLYVPEVLAEGLATEDLTTYVKQQFRWARGALDVIFRWNPFLIRGLTWAQRIQYLSSASFYLSGVVVVIDALLPLFYFYAGLLPVRVSGMLLAAIFLPYFFCTMYTILRASNFTFTFASLCYSMGSFAIHVHALYAALRGERSAFKITEKTRQGTVALRLVAAHLAYTVLTVIGIEVSFFREGISASLVNNAAWAILNIAVFTPFIVAALPSRDRAFEIPKSASETHVRQEKYVVP
jgi:cellulose synthase (UDP-forming)